MSKKINLLPVDPAIQAGGWLEQRNSAIAGCPEIVRSYILQLEESARDGSIYRKKFEAVLGPELLARREEQDRKHGGPEHDDTHTPDDWCRFIQDYAYRARIACVDRSEVGESRDFGIVELLPSGAFSAERADAYENKLMDVAGLAISAIQSSRRRNHPWRWLPGEYQDGSPIPSLEDDSK